jgi:hypothetical protein
VDRVLTRVVALEESRAGVLPADGGGVGAHAGSNHGCTLRM